MSESGKRVQPPIGIDLGTTYSVVAYLDDAGRPTTVINNVGDNLTPTALLFDGDELVVGKEAAKGSVMSPDGFVECFKRDMGASRFRQNINDVEIPPEVLSGFVLQRLKEDAERRLGEIREAVITVPAFFDEKRRRATQAAGALAGFEVLDIINEPTAAALAYGYQSGFLTPGEVHSDQRLLVYDLGGGTFDVTILDISGDRFCALATDGDVRLGGKDFDERIVSHVADQFLQKHGRDPRSDAADHAALWLEAQQAKHALSARQRYTVVCVHAGIRFKVKITRDEFEEKTRDLLGRTETTTSLVVKQAGTTWDAIDRVLVVGGSSRMPMGIQMLQQLTGKTVDQSISPDEAVAHGAALYAAMLMKKRDGELAGVNSQSGEFALVNVNSHSLGIVGRDVKTNRLNNKVVIPKNTPLPHDSKWIKCQTSSSGQLNVVVPVVEGESRRPEECISLGKCVVQDLPEELPAGSDVFVQYRYQADGTIQVSAKLPDAGREATVEIAREEAQVDGSLEVWRKRLAKIEPSKEASAVATQTVTSAEANLAADMQKQLDAIFVEIGQAAVNQDLPALLKRNQQMLQATQKKLETMRNSLVKAMERVSQAAGGAERMRFSTEVARIQREMQSVQKQVEFGYLILGKVCVGQRHEVVGASTQMNEARRLQAGL